MLVLRACTADRRKAPCLTTNEFRSLCRPWSDPCGVLTCSQCKMWSFATQGTSLSARFVLRRLSGSHYIVSCGKLLCCCIPGWVKTSCGLSSLMWVYSLRVFFMFLLRLSFRKASGPWLVCTDLSGLFSIGDHSGYSGKHSSWTGRSNPCKMYKSKIRLCVQCRLVLDQLTGRSDKSFFLATLQIHEHIFISWGSQSYIFTSVFKV